MRSILNDNIVWRNAQTARKWQRATGRVSGIFLVLALLALFDGLLAEMRSGPNELELLPGQTMLLSGPVALKNPLNSDVIVRFNPLTDTLVFELEGFFTGYWLGAGMWRGRVTARDAADPGVYRMRISFRGAPAQSAQNYTVAVFANEDAKRASAKSYFRRYLNINPFILAAFSGAIGVLLGCLTYFYGRKYAIFLAELGMSEVYRANLNDGRLWCLAATKPGPRICGSRMVLDKSGRLLGPARIEDWQKGKVSLTMLDGGHVPTGSLVCLHPIPETQKAE